MKTIKIILTAFLMGSFCSNVFAQEEIKGTKQKLEFNIDDLGNADIILTMNLNAQQWNAFKQTAGSNPANLKREMIKGLPTVHLTDFKYEDDPMERSYTFSMKGLAAAQQDKNGKWKSELDMKDPEILKLSDHQFRLDLNMLVNGSLVEQTQLINLPKNAKNAKIETDSFGYAVLTYETGKGLGHKAIKGLGVLLFAGGLFLGFRNLKTGKTDDEQG